MKRLIDKGYDSLVYSSIVGHCFGYEKVKLLEEEYNNYRRELRWDSIVEVAERLARFWNSNAQDILMDELTKAVKGHPRVRDFVFGHSDNEGDLYLPIERYLRQKGEIFGESVISTYNRKDLPVGNPDFVTVKRKRFGRKVVYAIDAKASLQSLHVFYHQASKYLEGCDHTILATTKWVAAQEDERYLYQMLNRCGAGLIYVDMFAKNRPSCDLVSKPRKGSPNDRIKENLLTRVRWR